MEEVWKRIANHFVNCYDTIDSLQEHNLMTEDERAKHEHHLLLQIITAFRKELEEDEVEC